MSLPQFKTFLMFMRNKNSRNNKFYTSMRYARIKSWKYLNIERNFNLPSDKRIKMHYYPGCCVSEFSFINGDYDYDNMRFIRKFCRNGEVFYDIGANVGSFSLIAHASGACVYAFEGAPSTLKRLHHNFLLNNINQNQIIHAAVSDHTGIVRFSDVKGSSVNKIGKNINSVEVPCIKIDNFVKTNPAPTFVKIDTEGHELHIILGMKELIKSGYIKYLMFEANGILNKDELEIIYFILTKSKYKIGLIDFENKVFKVQSSLDDRSPTGDYQAISDLMCTHIKNNGFKFL